MTTNYPSYSQTYLQTADAGTYREEDSGVTVQYLVLRNMSDSPRCASGITQFDNRTRTMPLLSQSDRRYVGDCTV